MTPVKYFSLVIRSLLTLIVIFGFILAMLFYMNLSFSLNGARSTVAEKIENYTGRDTRIDGRLKLTISLPPQLLVEQIHISNIEGFGDEDFVSLDEVRIEVSLLPLLSGQLHLGTIAANQATIKLLQKKDGRNNWSFENNTQPSKPADPLVTKNRGKHVTLGTFQLTNVALSYKDESRAQVIKQQLDRLIIDMKDRNRPFAEIYGDVQGYPYAFKFESDALESLSSGKQWSLHGSGTISGRQTDIRADIKPNDDGVSGNLEIDIKQVDLGVLLSALGIVAGQDAATDNLNIKTSLLGSNLTELYQQAEITLQLGGGYWNLKPADNAQNKKLLFSEASSFTSWNKPVELHLDGSIAGETIKIDFKTNRLLEFFDEVKELDVDLISKVADSDLTMKGVLELPIKTNNFKLDISLRARDLEKLNPIINTDFPAFNDFTLSGNLIANEQGFVLKSARASIGDTEFQSSIVIETNHSKTLWSINLSSAKLQLNDFAFDDWDMSQAISADSGSTEKITYKGTILEPLRRIEQTVRNPRMHFNLNLKADKILSGEDILGKARFQLHLRDDALSLRNADIEIPGGRIITSVSLEIENEQATGQAILKIDKLDYGIVTRLFNPESRVDGIISTDIDLELAGNNFTEILGQASGQLDIAVWPKNTRPAKALNLWTTNLYLILLPELKKKESLVNCMVGLMNLEDGTMREEFFAIDTTKLWINGNINADFKQEYVKLSLFPQSKTARLFSFQSPIRVEGNFSDIGMAINPMDLTGSYISFITSPLHVPARWIFGDKVPADGSAICEKLFDREYVEKLNADLEIKRKDELEEILQSD